MTKRDYYEILAVAKDADEGELKKAYRKLAMRFHPDRNPGDHEAEEKFKEINEAYEVLTDPARRQVYDQYGHEGLQRGGGGGADFGGGFADIFGDVFADIFGGARGGPRRGSDLRYMMELSLEEAVFGVERTIRIPKLESCEDCGGSGAKSGSKPSTCRSCDGSGQVRIQQGFFVLQQTCPQCRGRGSVIADPCGSCRGAGRVRKEKSLSVKVPPGVDTGDRIRLSGEGEAGAPGAPAGDLYVQVNIKPHEMFERDGMDLYCSVPISVVTAALGGEMDVPTLSGNATLKIPEATQSGKTFRLRGKGVPNVRGAGIGDLLISVVVETPVKLDKRQKDLLREFGDSLAKGNERHTPEASSWLEKAKRFVDGLKS